MTAGAKLPPRRGPIPSPPPPQGLVKPTRWPRLHRRCKGCGCCAECPPPDPACFGCTQCRCDDIRTEPWPEET